MRLLTLPTRQRLNSRASRLADSINIDFCSLNLLLSFATPKDTRNSAALLFDIRDFVEVELVEFTSTRRLGRVAQ